MVVKDLITLLMEYPEDAKISIDINGDECEIERDDWGYEAGTNQAILYVMR